MSFIFYVFLDAVSRTVRRIFSKSISMRIVGKFLWNVLSSSGTLFTRTSSLFLFSFQET